MRGTGNDWPWGLRIPTCLGAVGGGHLTSPCCVLKGSPTTSWPPHSCPREKGLVSISQGGEKRHSIPQMLMPGPCAQTTHAQKHQPYSPSALWSADTSPQQTPDPIPNYEHTAPLQQGLPGPKYKYTPWMLTLILLSKNTESTADCDGSGGGPVASSRRGKAARPRPLQKPPHRRRA